MLINKVDKLLNVSVSEHICAEFCKSLAVIIPFCRHDDGYVAGAEFLGTVNKMIVNRSGTGSRSTILYHVGRVAYYSVELHGVLLLSVSVCLGQCKFFY